MPRGLVAMARSGGHCPLRVSGGILCSERGQSCDAFQAIPLEETSPRCNNQYCGVLLSKGYGTGLWYDIGLRYFMIFSIVESYCLRVMGPDFGMILVRGIYDIQYCEVLLSKGYGTGLWYDIGLRYL